jgi:hypothetical protein
MCNSTALEVLPDDWRILDGGQQIDDRVDPDEFDGDDGLGIDEDDDTDEVILSPEEVAAILDEQQAYRDDMDAAPGWPTQDDIDAFERGWTRR